MDKLREKTGDLIAQSAGNAFALEQLAYKLADGQARLRERVRALESVLEQVHAAMMSEGAEDPDLDAVEDVLAARRGEG